MRSYANIQLIDSNLDAALFEIHADFCSVLCNPTRVRIMWFLADGETSVTDLATTLGLPVPNVSQHLRIMRDRGAVRMRKDGQKVYYRVANPKFIEGYKLISEGIREERDRETQRLSESNV